MAIHEVVETIQNNGSCGFIPDAIVAGRYAPLRDYAVGDDCVSLDGKSKVTKISNYPYSGQMIEFKATGLLPIKIMPNQEVLVTPRVDMRKNRHGSPIWNHLAPTWKLASQIKPAHYPPSDGGDYLMMPRLIGWVSATEIDLRPFATSIGFKIATSKGAPATLPVNEDSAWLLGLYVAEGSPAGDGPKFTLGKHENDLAEKAITKIQMIGYNCYFQKRITQNDVHLFSLLLKRAFKHWCGPYSCEKRIPEFILYHKDPKIIDAFWIGYSLGDGYHSSESGHIIEHASTCSLVLALQLQLLTARLGRALCVIKTDRPLKGVVCGRPTNQNPIYRLRRPLSDNYYHLTNGQLIKPNHILFPIRSISCTSYNGTVSHLETTQHNCLVGNVMVRS